MTVKLLLGGGKGICQWYKTQIGGQREKFPWLLYLLNPRILRAPPGYQQEEKMLSGMPGAETREGFISLSVLLVWSHFWKVQKEVLFYFWLCFQCL